MPPLRSFLPRTITYLLTTTWQRHSTHLTLANTSHSICYMDSSAPQDLQSLQLAPSSYPRPVPGDLCGHSGVVRDAMFPPANAAGNHRPVEHWEDIPLLIENNAAQGQPQGVLYVDMGYYNMGNDHPTLRECHDNAIDNHANVALDVPVQGHAAPLAPVCTNFVFLDTCI
ncbi:hypothetical protein BJV77DRAFT_1010593 [Russula vinacea]|nr:hypothetical protein BJV77DRAFT_1010593 [Russula vinacea]